VSAVIQDLAHAVRALTRRPAFTAVAVGTIAFAIAANTAIFSIVNGVLLRPLPFPRPDELVTLNGHAPTGFYVSTSIPNYRDWRDRNHSFQSYAGFAGWGFTLTGDRGAEVIGAQAVIGDFFGMLGLRPALGRLPGAEETAAHAGMDAVVVLGHAFWQRRFGGDSSVIGRVLKLDNRPYTVVGVLPAGVGFPEPDVEVYAPMGSVPDLPWDDRESGFGTRVIARLKAGVPLLAARQDLDRVGREVRAEGGPRTPLPEVQSLTTYFVGDVRTQLWTLMGAVGFVLLIAVANVGNLMLARGEERHRELTLRTVLGAGRGAIVRLLLAESLLLAVTGGVLGIALAYATVGVIVPLLPASLPAVLVHQVHVDGTVLAVALGAALATGILFGVAPALQSAGASLASPLKSGTRTTAAGGRLRPALVVVEMTLALIVLVGAGLMLESLDRLGRVDKGFDPSGVLTAAVPTQSPDRAGWWRFYHDLREQAAALPGVRNAALALLLPLSHRSWELGVYPEGAPTTPETVQSVLYNVVSPEFFDAMGVPIVRGRDFTAADRDGAPLVAIVDESMAQRFWPGADPIGKRVTIEQDSAKQPVYRTVVGVTKNVRHYELEAPSRIQVYVPADQTYLRWGMNLRLVLKTDGPPARLIAPLRDLVTRLDPNAPLTGVQTEERYVDDALARPRAMTRVLAVFACGALALAALGIFGVISYDVTRRTREIGIRMALGAAARDVMRWIVARALRLTVLGLVLGLAGAAALTRLLRGMLFEVSPLDPVILVCTALGLAAIAVGAACLPARRATRINPMTVLNEEG